MDQWKHQELQNKTSHSFILSLYPSLHPALLPFHLFLSSPLGRSCVSVVSVSPEVFVVLGGTTSFGFQDPGEMLLIQPLAQPQPQYTPLNQSLILLLSLSPLLPHSLTPSLNLNLNLLLTLKQPQPHSPVPAPAPDAAPGCPV